MIRYLLIFFFPIAGIAQDPSFAFTSKHTSDTYDIIVKLPERFDRNKSYVLVVFPDAGINSGKELLDQPASTREHCILVGISQRGNWQMKRQRDFIPSDAGGYNNNEFGQASKFYLFLKNELLPSLNKKYRSRKEIFIGHSFGGLMALYLSLRDNTLFDHYYAISPSVWANYGELRKIEEKYAATHKKYQSNISMYAGSLEFLNKVLSSTSAYYDTLKGRSYQGLNVKFDVIAGVNHYGIVPKIVPVILKEIK